jgi:class 3 adenylate cyclase
MDWEPVEGSVAVRALEPDVASTRVLRTFAFVDLCGFTDFADLQGDEAAVKELRVLRAAVREAAGAAGVRVDKWLGDGVMLVGVEARPLIAAVVALQAHHEANGRLPLRGGIASGQVILLDGDDYVGRAVNLASRLCERAEPDQVLAAADAARSLPPGVHPTALTSVHVKGFGRPRSPAGRRPARGCTRRDRRLHANMARCPRSTISGLARCAPPTCPRCSSRSPTPPATCRCCATTCAPIHT